MTRWQEAETPDFQVLQTLRFRDDINICSDAKEVIAKVRGNRHALGFFACSEPLFKQDLHGVRVLAVSEGEGKPAVVPPLDLEFNPAYAMAEPLTL